MGRVLVLVVMACVTLAGCGGAGSGASSQVEKQEKGAGVEEPEKKPAKETVSVPVDVPEYSLTKDEQGMVAGAWTRAVAASTDATSEKDLEAITRELWVKGPEADALQVLFYPNAQGDTTGTGMAFANEEAARSTFQAMSAEGADPETIEADVQKAMQNDGVYVIPTEQIIDEAIAEQCAQWDTTTLGSPPPEWECPPQ